MGEVGGGGVKVSCELDVFGDFGSDEGKVLLRVKEMDVGSSALTQGCVCVCVLSLTATVTGLHWSHIHPEL